MKRLDRIKLLELDASKLSSFTEKTEPISLAERLDRATDIAVNTIEGIGKAADCMAKAAERMAKASEDWKNRVKNKVQRDLEIWESKAPEREAAHQAKMAALKAEIAVIERDTAELKRKREKQS